MAHRQLSRRLSLVSQPHLPRPSHLRAPRRAPRRAPQQVPGARGASRSQAPEIRDQTGILCMGGRAYRCSDSGYRLLFSVAFGVNGVSFVICRKHFSYQYRQLGPCVRKFWGGENQHTSMCLDISCQDSGFKKPTCSCSAGYVTDPC